jgi:ABC-type glycerol-3-phosphate transport system substrate-binding protein
MRRWMAVVAAAIVSAGCGGGAAAPSAVASASADPARLVVLDASNFDALVLASGQPCLVEFQLPT